MIGRRLLAAGRQCPLLEGAQRLSKCAGGGSLPGSGRRGRTERRGRLRKLTGQFRRGSGGGERLGGGYRAAMRVSVQRAKLLLAEGRGRGRCGSGVGGLRPLVEVGKRRRCAEGGCLLLVCVDGWAEGGSRLRVTVSALMPRPVLALLQLLVLVLVLVLVVLVLVLVLVLELVLELELVLVLLVLEVRCLLQLLLLLLLRLVVARWMLVSLARARYLCGRKRIARRAASLGARRRGRQPIGRLSRYRYGPGGSPIKEWVCRLGGLLRLGRLLLGRRDAGRILARALVRRRRIRTAWMLLRAMSKVLTHEFAGRRMGGRLLGVIAKAILSGRARRGARRMLLLRRGRSLSGRRRALAIIRRVEDGAKIHGDVCDASAPGTRRMREVSTGPSPQGAHGRRPTTMGCAESAALNRPRLRICRRRRTMSGAQGQGTGGRSNGRRRSESSGDGASASGHGHASNEASFRRSEADGRMERDASTD